MKIGLFAPYDLARPGGVGSHIRAQARALRSLGHGVTIYGPSSAPLADAEVSLGGAITVTFGGTAAGAGFDPRSARRVARVLADARFDVVHVHEPLMPLVPWCAVWFADAPVVGTFHVHREDGHRFYPIGRPLLARIIARLSRRLAVSEAARRTVAAHFPGDYEIVPNGIDVDAFRRPSPPPGGMDDGRRHVLFVGRLEPRKGVEHLIAAMPEVQRRDPSARLIVVGDGPGRAGLESAARASGCDVRFAGPVADNALPAYFQWADLVCSPAIGGESFGIVLLEALACETPVVATRIEGYNELLGHVDCGRLVPPADASALSAAIGELLENESTRRACGARGLQVARTYDWPVIGRRLESIYQAVLEQHPSDRQRTGA